MAKVKDTDSEPERDVMGMANFSAIAGSLDAIRETLQHGQLVNAAFLLGGLHGTIMAAIAEVQDVDN